MYGSTIFGNSTSYGFTGVYRPYVAPVTGIYKLECWGAAGSYGYSNTSGGRGAYASGVIQLRAREVLYIFVGQCPNGSNQGGWNGGGNANTNRPGLNPGGGGGATDIRYLGTSLYNRIVVAAGGSGGTPTGVVANQHGGAANSYGNYPATQFGPGNGGAFGQGAHNQAHSSYPSGGAGGGWYGGGALQGNASSYTASSGGSSYVFTSSSYTPPGYLVPRAYALSDPTLIYGGSYMPMWNSSGTELGHLGHGIALISYFKTISDMTFQHYAIMQNGKYYIPTQSNYNFVKQEFTPVTLKYLQSFDNLKSFIYDINDLNKDILINDGKKISPLLFFNNLKIVKIVINYTSADDDATFSKYYKIINSGVLINQDVKVKNVKINYKQSNKELNIYKIEILEKFDSDNKLNHKLLGFNLSSNIKFLIKYRGRLYDKNLNVIENDDNLILRAIDIKYLNKMDINFNMFSIVIFFTNHNSSELTQVKYINQQRAKIIKLIDSDVTIKCNEDNIIVIPNVNKDYLYLNITHGMTEEKTTIEKF